MARRVQHHRLLVMCALQITIEGWITNQVANRLLEIASAGQLQHGFGRAIEPLNAQVLVEHQRAIGHGRGRLTEFAQHFRQGLFATPMALLASIILIKHLTPQPPRLRRRALPTRAQPLQQTKQLIELTSDEHQQSDQQCRQNGAHRGPQ